MEQNINTDEQASCQLKSIKNVLDHAFQEIDKAYSDPHASSDSDNGVPLLNKLLIDDGSPRLSTITVPEAHISASLGALVASSLALSHDRAVAYFSMSASCTYLAIQMLCAKAKVKCSDVISGRLPREEWPRLSTAAGAIADSNIYIDDRRHQSIDSIGEKIGQLKSDVEINLVIIDNLQLIPPQKGTFNDLAQKNAILVGLRELAEQHNNAIMLLSHSSKLDPDIDRLFPQCRWMLDAELSLKSQKAEEQITPLELEILLNRNGPTGVVKLV